LSRYQSFNASSESPTKNYFGHADLDASLQQATIAARFAMILSTIVTNPAEKLKKGLNPDLIVFLKSQMQMLLKN